MYDEYIKLEIGAFYCLICKDNRRCDGSITNAKEHLKINHAKIADQLQDETNKKIKDLFSFHTPTRTFVCSFCNKSYKGSLFNAKDHVASRHKDIALKLGFLEEQEARKQLKLQNYRRTR